MTEILVTASAPNRETALEVIQALGIARLEGDALIPLVDVLISEVPKGDHITRSLWNFWYFGNSAAALLKPEPEGGWLPSDDVFERTYLLGMVDGRTGIAMQWNSLLGVDGEPPGYETPNGVRLYDQALIASPMNVKQ